MFLKSVSYSYPNLFVLLAVLVLGGEAFAQNFTENFNTNSVTQLESAYCWDFYDVSISGSTNHLNSGGDANHAHADITDVLVVWGNSPSMTTPFLYFDGNTDITFTHRLQGTLFIATAYLRLTLINENGVETVISTQYAQISKTTITLNVTVIGNYRVKWGWDAVGVYADLDAGVDDITITATTVAPVLLTDTACPDDANVVYEFGFPSNSATYYYDWSFTGVSGGSITPLTSNERKAQVDWSAGPGNYQILAVEYSDASHTKCTGRETYYDVYVPSLPDVEAAADTLCEGEDFRVNLKFDGTGPWVMKYDVDGGVTQSKTFSATTGTLAIPWGASVFNIKQLSNGGVCDKTSNLPSVALYYHPGPSAGAIYHY